MGERAVELAPRKIEMPLKTAAAKKSEAYKRINAQGVGAAPLKPVASNPTPSERKVTILNPPVYSSASQPQKPVTQQAPRAAKPQPVSKPKIEEERLQREVQSVAESRDDDQRKLQKKLEIEEKRKQMREDMKKRKMNQPSDKGFEVEIFTAAGKAIIEDGPDLRKNDPFRAENVTQNSLKDLKELTTNHIQSEGVGHHKKASSFKRAGEEILNVYDQPSLRIQYKTHSVENLNYPREVDMVFDMPLKKDPKPSKIQRSPKHKAPPQPVLEEPKELSPRAKLGFGDANRKNQVYLNQDYSEEGIEIYVKGAPPKRPLQPLPVHTQSSQPVLDFKRKSSKKEPIDEIPDERPKDYGRMSYDSAPRMLHELTPMVAAEYNSEQTYKPPRSEPTLNETPPSFEYRNDMSPSSKQSPPVDRTRRILKFLPDVEPEVTQNPESTGYQGGQMESESENDFGRDLESVSKIDTKKSIEEQLSTSYAVINVKPPNTATPRRDQEAGRREKLHESIQHYNKKGNAA